MIQANITDSKNWKCQQSQQLLAQLVLFNKSTEREKWSIDFSEAKQPFVCM